jgi:hypothetical protein
MSDAPEMVAVAAAREVTHRARAMEALSSDKWSLGARLGLAFLMFVIYFFSTRVIVRFGNADQAPYVIIAFALAACLIAALGMEIYYLRRRVKALTYLLLQLEHKGVG